jgi:ribosomal protein S27E
MKIFNLVKCSKAIDEELIRENKTFLTISAANQLLIEKKIFSESDKGKKTLKKILQTNQIPHAKQTLHRPRQWRIPVSENAKITERKKSKPAKEKSKPISKSLVQKVSCPNCNSELIILEDAIHSARLNCLLCGKDFKNPYVDSHANTQKNWTIAIIVISIIIVIAVIVDNNSSSTSSSSSISSLYYVNTTTYATTSKADFDEMFDYIVDKDQDAISNMIQSGRIITIHKGTEVFLEKAAFGYDVVRARGSTQKLWIPMEVITQK